MDKMKKNTILLKPINGEKDTITLYDCFKREFNNGDGIGNTIGHVSIPEIPIYFTHLSGVEVIDDHIVYDGKRIPYSLLQEAALKQGLEASIWPHSIDPFLYYLQIKRGIDPLARNKQL
ncbi:MAG: hypothetical protein V2A62_02435 [Candidatus Woesearchaeota archaeon]